MTLRRPIVEIDGVLQELPLTDPLGVGSIYLGTSHLKGDLLTASRTHQLPDADGVLALKSDFGVMRQATWNVPEVNVFGQYTFAINPAPLAVSATSLVIAQLMPTEDWDADDLADFTVTCEPADDTFIYVTLTRPGPIGGTFRVAYQVF